MLDLNHLPTGSSANIQVFTRISTFTVQEYQTWMKPRGISMVHILCIGGGGGGGAGGATSGTTAMGGGGGGGSSGMMRLLIPAFALPDICYVQVGMGGAGGTSGAGSSGVYSYVAIQPSNAGDYIVTSSGSGVAGGGAVGTSTGGGAGGTAGAIPSTSQARHALYSIPMFIAGQTGGAGGSQIGAIGGATTWSGLQTVGGGGGAGAISTPQFNGGAVTGAGPMPTIEGGAAGTSYTNGGGGIVLQNPLLFTGGSGGASEYAYTGVNAGCGGDGAYGCGGGGGGAGYNRGAGGRGGDGIVIITAW